ncbi:MAG: hypothetical protein CO108_13500, partial [Deltaproteobacteria bacterium CG_4_9_14_3_um_filter_63_12]
MARIVYRDTSNQEVVIQLNASSPEVSVGRNPNNTIRLQNASISRNHATISFQGGQCILKDLGSSNGCYVNGKRVQSQALTDGDKIRCGEYPLEFFEDAPAVASPNP